MLDNLREKKPCQTQRSGSSDRSTCYRLFSFFRFFLFFFTRPYLSYHSRRSAFVSVGGGNCYGDAAEQEQEVGDTPQRGAAALCWKGKKQLLSAPRADAALAWLLFFCFFLRVADDKLAKGGGDTAASSFSSVELSHSDFLRKIGKGSRDLEPQSSLLFHAKKKL